MSDFPITTMGIRLLVTWVIVEVCLLNSRQISAWSMVALVSGLTSGESSVRMRNTARNIQESVGLRLNPAEEVVKATENFTPDQNLMKQCQNESQNDTWTYLVLTIQWPQSFCLSYNDSEESGRCVVPEEINDWTIHGLWPSNPGEIGPACCNNSWKFDIAEISDIEKQMNESWPNFITNQPYYSLWSHEWEKHGTCASSLPALYGEHNYFLKTLTLRKQYNIKGMLEASGVYPSKTKKYNYQTIFSAVKEAVGTTPTLTCEYDSKTKYVYLSQVELCLNKEFQLVDCVAPNSVQKSYLRDENCRSDKDILYPVMTQGT